MGERRAWEGGKLKSDGSDLHTSIHPHLLTDLGAPPLPPLPLTAAFAALCSFAALFLAAGGSLVMAILAVSLFATYIFPYRIEAGSWPNLVVRALFLLLIVLGAGESANGANWLMDARAILMLGQYCGVELVLECWHRRRTDRRRSLAVIVFSGVTMVSACNTFEAGPVMLLGPLYFFFLILALRDFRERTPEKQRSSVWRMGTLHWALMILALGIGGLTHYGISRYRNEITNLAMSLLYQPNLPEPKGVSTSPVLGPSFDVPRSPARVLLIDGLGDHSHLRAAAFDTYRMGRWSPDIDQRPMKPATAAELNSSAPGPRAHFNRLEDEGHLIFLPLEAAGIAPPPSVQVDWNREQGGPVRAGAEVSLRYDVILGGDENHQGPLCISLSAAERSRCLAVPPEIDSRVRDVAKIASGRIAEPRQRVLAVASYLMSHHAYSLRFTPGQGDPVSNFLLQGKSGHCQYFASAAAILLRCIGIPARYVNGYYAHEASGPGRTVVRQRDAHAWTEAWIDGAGWITVDATPGGGRPDHTQEPVSFWVKAMEWVQDQFAGLKEWVSKLSMVQLALILLGLAAIGSFSVWWRTRNPSGGTAGEGFAYSSRDGALASLARQFEAFLARSGYPEPPYFTWNEHLAALDSPLFDRAAALRFVEHYNAARFGSTADPGAIEALSMEMAALNQKQSGN